MNNTIRFNNTSFLYEQDKPIFSNISLELPKGITSLVGQNGTGKSTLMLLAAGRLYGQEGNILIGETDTRDLKDELTKNKLASFVYQNMEFEAEEPLKDLYKIVFDSGNFERDRASLIQEIKDAFDLNKLDNRQFQHLSKGEMQKVCIAFSLLYGSKIIFMDEPVFALENSWKEKVLEFVTNFCRKEKIDLFYSIHEFDLSQKYSENCLLFKKDRSILSGPTEKILQKEVVEEAYQVPMELLYQREELIKERLNNPVDYKSLEGTNAKVFE